MTDYWRAPSATGATEGKGKGEEGRGEKVSYRLRAGADTTLKRGGEKRAANSRPEELVTEEKGGKKTPLRLVPKGKKKGRGKREHREQDALVRWPFSRGNECVRGGKKK